MSPTAGVTYSVPRVPKSEEGAGERGHALRGGAEAEHLDRGPDGVEDPAEQGHAEYRSGDGAPWIRRFLAQRGGRLETGEGQEAEHDAQEQGAGADAGRDGEHVQGEGW